MKRSTLTIVLELSVLAKPIEDLTICGKEFACKCRVFFKIAKMLQIHFNGL